MQHATHRRHFSITHLANGRKSLPAIKLAKARLKLKKAYYQSLKSIKTKPLRAIGFATLGLGVASALAAAAWWNLKK